MTISANDAHEFPIYAGRYRVYFPLLDADGDLVTAAATPDSERSIDGATFADCSLEMVEVATGSGVYYLDLISTEMTSKCTVVIAKSATSGMKTTVLTLYPKRMPVLRSGTAQAGAASSITLDSGAASSNGAYNGLWVQCTNNTPANVLGQTRKVLSYVGATKVATIEGTWGTNPSSATNFDILCPETANVQAWNGQETADTHTAGYPVVTIKDGTGTGELDTASGVVLAKDHTGANLATAATQATLATSAGQSVIQAKTDLIPGTQDGKTFAEVVLLMASALLAKVSGMATTTVVFRAVDDSQNRITATVDADGNRSAVTYDTTSP